MASPAPQTALRQAGPGDADAIRRLTRAAYAKWVPILGREPMPMTANYEESVLKHRFDLLTLDGALVGLIETHDEGEALLIVNVAIAPEWQGRGLGPELVAHAETLARALQRPRIRLYTNQRMTANIALYKRLGYAVTGETEMSPGAIRVDMSKTLSA